ncbi:MAG TPA: hypothetical protein VKR81_09425 [Candidatus Binatia bacterium]|nr:hypothetical protein [Candidatus Binatia bacterium]
MKATFRLSIEFNVERENGVDAAAALRVCSARIASLGGDPMFEIGGKQIPATLAELIDPKRATLPPRAASKAPRAAPATWVTMSSFSETASARAAASFTSWR